MSDGNGHEADLMERRADGAGRRGPRVVWALLVGVLAPILLVAPTASADDGDLRPRLEAACARLVTATERLDRAIARLDAPASERGSLAWFQAAVERATANNRPRIAAELQQRLDRLTERRAKLDERAAQLDRFAARCAELGAGA